MLGHAISLIQTEGEGRIQATFVQVKPLQHESLAQLGHQHTVVASAVVALDQRVPGGPEHVQQVRQQALIQPASLVRGQNPRVSHVHRALVALVRVAPAHQLGASKNPVHKTARLRVAALSRARQSRTASSRQKSGLPAGRRPRGTRQRRWAGRCSRRPGQWAAGLQVIPIVSTPGALAVKVKAPPKNPFPQNCSDLTSMNSSRPSRPNSRPLPDCL